MTECRKSEFVVDIVPETPVIQLYDPEAVIMLLEPPTDTATEYLKTLPEFRDSGCGEYRYTQTTLHTMVVQTSDQEYAIKTKDLALVGTQQLDILIESISYPGYIAPIVISVLIEVERCEVLELLKPEKTTFSPLYLVFNLPFTQTVDLPLFEPSPTCGKSNAEIDYTLVGELPDWIKFSKKQRQLVATSEDPELIGKTFPVELEAKLEQALASIKFAIVFLDPGASNQTIEIEPVVDEE